MAAPRKHPMSKLRHQFTLKDIVDELVSRWRLGGHTALRTLADGRVCAMSMSPLTSTPNLRNGAVRVQTASPIATAGVRIRTPPSEESSGEAANACSIDNACSSISIKKRPY
jgi:hypothetical protein